MNTRTPARSGRSAETLHPLDGTVPLRGRLRWSCRRGMRELDLLLTHFVEHHLDMLGDEGLAAFERLLEYPDTLLYDYLMQRQVTDDAEIMNVITSIRTQY